MDRTVTDPAYHPLVRSVVRGLRQRCGVREGARILVAVSGGADSVALLRALKLLAPRRRWRLGLAVGHVQHHLRDDAEADAEFVEQLAHQLKLPFHRRDIRLDVMPGNLEAAAREMRYEALKKIAQEADSQYVATAHHADDQLETLLMRLLRGTTIQGLRGIAWQRSLKPPPSSLKPILLIRPMLGVTHDQAVDFLRRIDQPWREDHTNADRSRTRARLRHDVLPVLRELRPGVAHKAVELADHARWLHHKNNPPAGAGGRS